MTKGSSLSGLLTSICHFSFVIGHLTENPCRVVRDFLGAFREERKSESSLCRCCCAVLDGGWRSLSGTCAQERRGTKSSSSCAEQYGYQDRLQPGAPGDSDSGSGHQRRHQFNV